MNSLTQQLASHGYWPAQAARLLESERYAGAVELCRQQLAEEPYSLAGRLLLAKALYAAGQTESAIEEFYQVLAADPENIAALKYLADIRFASGDEMSAIATYQRILEIDPACQALRSDLASPSKETVRTITITRGEEIGDAETTAAYRRIPFFTETMADLYLNQGHSRLAAMIYQKLAVNNRHPRLLEKLASAERHIKEKDKRNLDHVHFTDQ
ncbi:MAG: tetratricopeptide repeat protein [Candidatus Zixiibacteriota bacterium]